MSGDETRFVRIPTNGITLNVAEAGPEDGPLAILLHGFPEFWYGWRHQIGPLARAGYRVLAPDQRGYNRSDKSRGIGSYNLDALVDDVVGLVDACGRDRAAIVVGHDWGGIVAWWALTRAPGRFERAAILNAPHPRAIVRELRENPAQLLKSWYTFAFQIPGLPEVLLRRNGFAALSRGMVNSSRSGTFTEADLALYRDAWSQPGALSAMIHWYRAGARRRPPMPDDPRVDIPTLLIWGVKDRFLSRGVARLSYALCSRARLEWIEETTHWVHHEEPERVNRLLLDLLSEPSRPTS